MQKLLYIWLLTGFSFTFAQNQSTNSHVLMVSFEGFRHDYVEKFHPPHFEEFISKGSYAKSLIPSYPSKTFPNHYTLVTGLYPGHHGLIDNSFYDSNRDETYSMGKRELVQDAYYYGGMPLWQLAQKHGMKSASYFWVGSEAPVAGSFPDYYYLYDGSVPNEDRIKQVIDWLQYPDSTRPRFITLYFSLVGSEGHRSGPNLGDLENTVMKADSLLGMLMQGLDSIDTPVNVLLTSDHGMQEMRSVDETYILMDDLIRLSDNSIKFNIRGTHVQIYGAPEVIKKKYMLLKARELNYKAYLKKRIPEQWHYTHERVADLLLVAEAPYYFSTRERMIRYPRDGSLWGTHGYDPSLPSMHGIFYAQGPDIKQGIELESFENVHIYPLVCQILQMEAPEIDGKAEVLMPILKE